MKRSIKRIVSLALAITILLTQMTMLTPTAFAEAAVGSVTYKPVRQKMGIAPAALYKDAEFNKQYVKTNEIWAFNSISYFTNNALYFNTEMKNYNATFKKNFSELDPVLLELSKKQQLLVNLRTCLANAKSGIFSSKIGIQEASILYYRYFWGAQDNSDYRVFGDNDFITYKGDSLAIEYEKVGKKGTRMKNTSLLFADATAPTISEVYATATESKNATKVYSFNSGNQAVYIHVKYNEYIRFSDNRDKHDDIYLKLGIAQIGGNEVTDANQIAKLIGLDGDTLTFRYDVPSTIKNGAINHYIYKFGGVFDNAGKNILNAGDDAYALRVLTPTGELEGHYVANTMKKYTSKSLITDLAGNPSGSINVSDPAKPIYLDSIAPYIKSVSFTATGDKSQYIGKGGRITPTITFSEPIYKKNGYQFYKALPSDFSVYLNVFYKGGNYVPLSGVKFNEDNTTLVFESMVIEEGMTLEYGDRFQIKYFNVSNPSPLDLMGNLLNKNDIPLPSNQFMVDTGNPQISTDMPQNSGVYTPALYDATNDGVKDSFYFSFGVNDPLSGVLPIGTENVLGSFKWELANSSTDTSKASFEYAVTNSPEKPLSYNKGTFKSGYTFPQVSRNGADNVFVHIKVDGLEGMDLNGSSLAITSKDLVGNTVTIPCALDGSGLYSILDQTPPSVTANKLYSYEESGTWKFAADMTMEDKGNVNVDEVWYQWVKKGQNLDETQWTKWSGLGSSNTTIKATVSKDLTTNQKNEYDLYVKVTDNSNNNNVQTSGPYHFAKDLSAPVFTSEITDSLTPKAQLKIVAQHQETTITAGETSEVVPAVMLVMVEDTSGYSVSTINTTGAGISIDNVFETSTGWVNKGNKLDQLVAGTYYGETKVKVVIGYGITYENGVVNNPYGSSTATEEYTLYTAPSMTKIHSITMQSSIVPYKGDFSDPEKDPIYITDLAGTTFNISVENAMMGTWGDKDIDFENSYFALYKENGNSPILVYKAQLGMSTSISIPAGLTYETGKYYAQAVVTAKTSGKEDKVTSDNVVVNVTQPEDFGLSKTITEWEFNDSSFDAFIGTHTELYGYDVNENPMTGLDKAYGNAPYLLLGTAADEVTKSIEHKLFFTNTSTSNEMFFKIWNASEGVDAVLNKAAAKWISINDGDQCGVIVSVIEGTENILNNYSVIVQGDNRFAHIPVMNNKENILYYQLCHANGNKSSERALVINASDEQPELEVTLTPENTPTGEVSAVVSKLSSLSTPDIKANYWNGTDSAKPIEDEIQLLQTDNNWFYACNAYGNYTVINKQAQHLDIEAPVLTTSQIQGEGDGYAIKVTLQDKNTCNLFMEFDDAYMTRLGLSGYFSIELPDANQTWLSKEARANGIYKIARTDNTDGSIDLTLYGVYLYDQNAAGVISNLGYYLYSKDVIGNESQSSGALTDVSNALPSVSLTAGTVEEKMKYIVANEGQDWQYKDMFRNLYSVTAAFSLPVNNVTPFQYHNATTDYSLKKDFLSIFKDGKYTVTYDDIFGNKYKVEKTVSDIVMDLNMELTGVDPITGNYSLSMEPVANVGKDFSVKEGERFAVFEDYYESTLWNTGYMRDLTALKTNQEFGQNKNAIIMFQDYYSSAWHIDHSKPFIIIDGMTRQAPKITEHYYYNEFSSDSVPSGETQTDGKVDVWITSDTPITGTNGKLLSHTFVYGEETNFNFEYETSDGRRGSRSVTLPVSIVESKQKNDLDDTYIHDDGLGIPKEDLIFTDTSVPEAYMEIYRKFGNTTQYNDIWDAASDATLLKSLLSSSWSSAFILKFNILDESKTKLLILAGENAPTSGITYANAQNAAIEGVALSGNNIVVAKPMAFTVLIIDEANNKQSISFSTDLWEKIDNVPPNLDTVEYKMVGFTTVDAYFSFKDDKSPADEILPISPVGLQKNAEGKYVLTFNENKGVEISMRDLAGNVGTGMASVSNIDDKSPVAKVAWWSPYLISGDTFDPTKQTTTKTNQTITVKLVIDKAIKSVSGKVDDAFSGSVPEDEKQNYVTWSNDTDSILVNFLQNSAVQLSFVSVNNKEGKINLSIKDLIDKISPTITIEKVDEKSLTTATVSFKAFSEPVYIYGPGESGKLYNADQELTKTYTERGNYTYRFTDKAGNTTTHKIEIKNIDEYSPSILLSELPVAGQYFKNSISFKATMSEEGTLAYNGTTQSVVAPVDKDGDGKIENDEATECHWVTFTATQNGSYPIIATDIAGRKTTAYVNINCFDRVAPTITFTPMTLSVLSSTDLPSFLSMLDTGITVQDNITAKKDIIITHEELNATQLSKPGVYQLSYTAKDLTGNEATAIRYVKVFSAKDISVTLNDIRTESKGATIINSKQVSLKVSNLPLGDQEPYKVYLRKGRWTEGEMKNVPKLKNAESFTIPEKEYFYTLYIVTQNRGTYLTYLYVQ